MQTAQLWIGHKYNFYLEILEAHAPCCKPRSLCYCHHLQFQQYFHTAVHVIPYIWPITHGCFIKWKHLNWILPRWHIKGHQHRFACSKCTKIVGSAPDATGGAKDTPPRPPSRLGRGQALFPRTLSARLSAYGGLFSFCQNVLLPVVENLLPPPTTTTL